MSLVFEFRLLPPFFSFFLTVRAWLHGGLSDKDRELGEAQAEIRALRLSERLREKAVEEVIISPGIFRLFSTLPFWMR